MELQLWTVIITIIMFRSVKCSQFYVCFVALNASRGILALFAQVKFLPTVEAYDIV